MILAVIQKDADTVIGLVNRRIIPIVTVRQQHVHVPVAVKVGQLKVTHPVNRWKTQSRLFFKYPPPWL